MFNKEKWKGFFAGVLLATVITSAVGVLAESIDVHIGGIKVFWDGVEETMVNVKGEKVEPMIYKGTTYIPVRDVGRLADKSIAWDQDKMSVYIGEVPTTETISFDKLPPEAYNKGNLNRCRVDNTFMLKDKEQRPTNSIIDSNDYGIYILDNQYTKLVAQAVMPYTTIGASNTAELNFYSVADDGSETKLGKTYELKQTDKPIDVAVNLKGVVNLKIQIIGSTTALYDIKLLGK